LAGISSTAGQDRLSTITIQPLPLIAKWPHQSEAPVGQSHPQGANSGSNGKLELMPTQNGCIACIYLCIACIYLFFFKLKMAATSPPEFLSSHVYQASPFRPALADRLTQSTASQAV
jgi:hypothetical protein